jgi:hypothetical protein
MTTLNPLPIGPLQQLGGNIPVDVPVFVSQGALYVRFADYTRIVQDHLEDVKYFGAMQDEYQENMQANTTDINDLTSHVQRTWTRRTHWSDKEKLAMAIAVGILVLLAVALTAALAITLVVLL